MNAKGLLSITCLTVLATIFIGVPAEAQAGRARVYVAKPLGPGTVTVTVSANGVSQSTSVAVQAGWSAPKKRDEIYKALQANGYSVGRGFRVGAGHYVSMSDLPNGAKASFDPGTTGESRDQVAGPNAAKGSIRFGGTYPSSGLDGRPSTFTAGVFTDRGRVEIEIRTDEFPPGVEIDGAYIAQRLFADLPTSVAASLGAFLDLDGDSIEVTFDPGATLEAGGVIFGTTSEGEGIQAGIEVL